MGRHRTFNQKIAAGFSIMLFLTVAIGAISVVSLRSVVSSKDRVISDNTRSLIAAHQLRLAAEQKSNSFRTFLLTGDERYYELMQRSRRDFLAILDRLEQTVAGPTEQRLLDLVKQAESDHQSALDRPIALRRSDAALDAVVSVFDKDAAPRRQVLDDAIAKVISGEQQRSLADKQAATEHASAAIIVLVVTTVVAALFAGVAAFLLTRALGRQIGTAVGHVQSSSAELEAAASQQATGAKEGATAMSEITTTVTELLVTSRQISEGAQRVAQIAQDTGSAALSGEGTIEQAHASIAAIRAQVDLIVAHMLELGEKSQQIGGVLELVAELAEQTNILAINATIEASGAGESGKRFGVVADEIRKLADRVAGSAKEIRGLIDDVRGAVNTTIMATETGSKAVDAGSRHFGAVAESFQRIKGLGTITVDASREIELSTKQQTTAVEQVNLAISDVAETTRATEVSSTQTRQTATQLVVLSTDLLRLVRAKGPA